MKKIIELTKEFTTEENLAPTSNTIKQMLSDALLAFRLETDSHIIISITIEDMGD